MHPNPKFKMEDETAMRSFVLAVGIVHLAVGTRSGPMMVHVPLTAAPGGHFRFHIARSNRASEYLDGAKAVASAMGPHGYISPDWYAERKNQVPTWNYATVEVEGTLIKLDHPALVEQIVALSALHEARLAPKEPWTMAKVDPALRDKMLSALRAFELNVTAIRGTLKLNQNKSSDDRAGVIEALDTIGNRELAAAMRLL